MTAGSRGRAKGAVGRDVGIGSGRGSCPRRPFLASRVSRHAGGERRGVFVTLTHQTRSRKETLAMHHVDVPQFLGLLVVTLGVAKLAGHLAQAVGQPGVLGELLAGVVLGASVLGLVDPSDPTLHLFGEIGVVILLFSIGMETELVALLKVGLTSMTVALAGVVVPFVLGYAWRGRWGWRCRWPWSVGAVLDGHERGDHRAGARRPRPAPRPRGPGDPRRGDPRRRDRAGDPHGRRRPGRRAGRHPRAWAGRRRRRSGSWSWRSSWAAGWSPGSWTWSPAGATRARPRSPP